MPVISGSDSRSGYLNLPPRVQLRERDSATGSYPTMARTGDPDFLGNKPIKFDDSRTVIFSDNVVVSYPTLLQPTGLGLKYISGSLATPNSGSDILATGTVRKGVADQFAFFDNSESIGPFREHLRVLPNEGSFYLTGTDPNVLPGFSNRLSSKTQVTIEFDVTGSTDVRFQTGSSGGTVGVNSGLAYYNWISKSWDVVGDLSSGSNIDYMRNDPQERVLAPLAFNNHAPIITTAIDPDTNQSMSGYPTTYCGFPFANQFTPRDAEALSLSGSITTPFLVEKVEVHFSASYQGFEDQSFGKNGPDTATMFLLNNFCQPSRTHTFNVQSEIDTTVITGGKDANANITTVPVLHISASYRDLVWYGIISRNNSDPNTDRDLNISNLSGTGSYTLKSNVRPPPMYRSAAAVPYRSSSNQDDIGEFGDPSFWSLTSCSGLRNGYDLSAGRSYGRSVIAVPVSRTFDLMEATAYNITGTLNIYDPFPDEQISPYLITPNDHLTLGFSCQPFGDNQQYVTFHPGKYRLTMYGSQIREGKEYHDTSNQPLNSDAIHEALHFDNPTVDQFQVEPLVFYSGTYIDDIVSGDFTSGTRGVVGSSAAGTQGLTGSLLRGVRVVDRGERFYDTVLPDPYNYIEGLGLGNTIGINLFTLSSNTTNYSGTFWTNNSVIFSGSNGYLTSSILSYWWESFPFEPQFANVKRDLEGNTAQKSNNAIFGLFTTSTVDVLVRNDYTGFNLSQNTLNKFWYGFGPGYLSSSISNPAVSSSYFRNYPRLRNVLSEIGGPVLGQADPIVLDGIDGFKYGVKNALPEFSSLVTRYDRYGQFRDMLEQRPDSRFSTGETVTDSPVIIRFVDPTSGNRITSPVSSSNKSKFATSSLPYFDGTTRN